MNIFILSNTGAQNNILTAFAGEAAEHNRLGFSGAGEQASPPKAGRQQIQSPRLCRGDNL
jgi:hypothetical protein